MKHWRKALWVSLVINTFIVLAELFTSHLHNAGYAQGVLGFVDGAGHVLQLPGFTAGDVLGLRPGHRWTIQAFWMQLAVNLWVWWIVFIAWYRWKNRVVRQIESRPVEERAQAGEQVSRRSLLVSGGRGVAMAGMSIGSYGFFAESRWFEVTRRQITIKGLDAKLDGLRIVQLSDIHHGAWMSIGWVKQIVDVANSLSPDLVALTGDYVYRGLEYTEPVAQALSALRGRIGVLGVLGNHDWFDNGVLTKEIFARHGIPMIDNDRRFITPDRRIVESSRQGLCIAGVGDLWEDKCLYDRAMGGVSGGIPTILMSHNPDVAEEPDFIRSGYRVDLMLSGHTHGGQISLPLVGSPVTNSRFGRKYAKGLVNGPVCPVYISRGLGMTVMPVRVGVRPEIAVIELRAEG